MTKEFRLLLAAGHYWKRCVLGRRQLGPETQLATRRHTAMVHQFARQRFLLTRTGMHYGCRCPHHIAPNSADSLHRAAMTLVLATIEAEKNRQTVKASQVPWEPARRQS
jgi:hypothetical protein